MKLTRNIIRKMIKATLLEGYRGGYIGFNPSDGDPSEFNPERGLDKNSLPEQIYDACYHVGNNEHPRYYRTESDIVKDVIRKYKQHSNISYSSLHNQIVQVYKAKVNGISADIINSPNFSEEQKTLLLKQEYKKNQNAMRCFDSVNNEVVLAL